MISEKEIIVGKTINLRNVDILDAAFILNLRLNPELNSHLSKTDSGLNEQTEWIKRYKENKNQFYFIIEDKNKNRLGTVRIYDLQPESFCWGSWIIQPGAPINTAIESALLVYEFSFFELGYKKAHFDVRKENSKVIAFHKRFGAKIIEENEVEYIFNYELVDYENIKKKYSRFLIDENI